MTEIQAFWMAELLRTARQETVFSQLGQLAELEQHAANRLWQRKESGAPGAIRTPGPQIRSLMLYPAELRVHWSAAITDGSAHVQ